MKRFQLWIKRPSRAFPFARPSRRGSGPAPRLLGWCGTPGGSYWPGGEEAGEVTLKTLPCHKGMLLSRETETDGYLTGISSGQIQHVEEEAELTGQTELLLAQMILHQIPDWFPGNIKPNVPTQRGQQQQVCMSNRKHDYKSTSH